MADEIDQINSMNETMQRHQGALLENSKRPEAGKHHTGHCYYCDAPVDAPRCWCDADCRDAWQAENE
jgi:hypothetical protein